MTRTISKEPVVDMQVRMDTATIRIPFVATTALDEFDSGYPDYETDYSSDYSIRCWFDGVESATSAGYMSIVQIDWDLYELQIPLSTFIQTAPVDSNFNSITFSNYIYVQLSEIGVAHQFYEKYCIIRLIPVSSGSGNSGSSSLTTNDISAIANAVWSYASGRSLTTPVYGTTTVGSTSVNLSLATTTDIPGASDIASSVWNYGNSSNTTLITRTLATAPSTLTASDVWNFGNNSGTALTARTLTTAPSTLTASDVWNYGNTGTTLTDRSLSQAITATATVDNHAIAHAVWTYGGASGDVGRSITTEYICFANGTNTTTTLSVAGECAGAITNSLSTIANAVWSYTNGRSLTTPVYGTTTVDYQTVDLSLATKADIEGISVSGGGSAPTASQVAEAVWGYTISSTNVISEIVSRVWGATTRELTQTVTANVNTGDIASAVWNFGNGSGTAIATRTLSSSPSSLTAADVWGYTTRTLTSGGGSGSTSINFDVDDIAEAVWGYEGVRELSTDLSIDFDTEDIAAAVWGSIKDNGELTALGEGLIADIATTVWTNTNRDLTTATLDDGELESDVLLTLGNVSQANIALGSLGLTAVATSVWGAPARSLTTNAIGNNTANYLAIKSDLNSLQDHGDSDWATPNDYATTSDIGDLQDHGDVEWATPDDYVTVDDLEGISTFDASSDTVLLSVEQQQDLAAYIVEGLATPSDIPVSDITAIKEKVDTLTNANLSTVTSAITAATSTLSDLITALDKPAALTTASVNAIRDGLATATNVSDAKTDILDSVSTLSSSVSDISSVVEAIPSASSIATAVWTSENKAAFAEELLSTDVISLPVETNGFTLTHLILASQNSTVEQAPNTIDDHTAVWKIRGLDSNEEPVIIATRTLMLNNYGGIVGTSTSTETSEEPAEEETP